MEAAKIRQVQGRSFDVIQLLDHNWQPESSSPDIEAQRLTLLSLAYARSGDTAAAAKAIDAAGQIHGISPSVNAEIFAARARFDLEEDRLADAESLFEKSLAAARSGNNRFFESSSLLNLSVISLQRNHYEDALEQSTAAAGVARILGAQVILEKAQGNAGWSLYETGDYQRALVSFNEAAANAHELGSTIDEANWLTTAGMSEARMGDYSAAQERYRRSLALARSLRNATQIVYADEALAALLLRSPQPEASTPYIHEAARLAQQKGSAFDIQLSDLLRAQLIGQTGDLSKSKALLLNVEQHAKSFPTVKLDSQHTLAQLCEKMANKHQAELWFKRSIATYREQRAQLRTDDARLPFFETGRDLYMDYVAFLVRNHRTDDALDLIDQGRAETLAEGLGVQNKGDGPRRVSLSRIARQSHAVILIYALSSQASYLWASNGAESGFYLLPDRSVILAAAAAHQRALLAARDLVTEQHPAARTLYDMLVKPAEQIFHPGDRVYIVGAGGISGLNFETLLTPGPSSHYWIEDVTITHFSSLRLPRHTSAAESRDLSQVQLASS